MIWQEELNQGKIFKIASDLKFDGYQRGLALMVYKFFDKKSASLDKSSGSGVATEPNDQLADELHRQTVRKFNRRKVYSSFRDNIWGVDLADMHWANTTKESIIYCVQSICLVSMRGLLLWKTKE